MFTLFVNGIAVLKLASKSEIPPREGKESWLLVDSSGRTVDFYFPV